MPTLERMPMSEQNATPEPDYDYLLRSNLLRVFNERDASKRSAALAELFVETPVMYEPAAIVRGQTAISDAAAGLLERFGPTFEFVPHGAAVGHHGLGYLRWHGGSKEKPALVSGTDAAEIVDGKIARLWVLLDAPDQGVVPLSVEV
jgi:hypothetical protein